MHKMYKCTMCGKIPFIECGADEEGFGCFYLEHRCEKDRKGDYRSVVIDINMRDCNKFLLIDEWNTYFGESDD